MLNRVVKNRLHGFSFLFRERSKHGFGSGRDANIGVFDGLHSGAIPSCHRNATKKYTDRYSCGPKRRGEASIERETRRTGDGFVTGPTRYLIQLSRKKEMR